MEELPQIVAGIRLRGIRPEVEGDLRPRLRCIRMEEQISEERLQPRGHAAIDGPAVDGQAELAKETNLQRGCHLKQSLAGRPSIVDSAPSCLLTAAPGDSRPPSSYLHYLATTWKANQDKADALAFPPSPFDLEGPRENLRVIYGVALLLDAILRPRRLDWPFRLNTTRRSIGANGSLACAGPLMARPQDVYPSRSWRTWLFGRPLPTADAPHQAIGKTVGLAVFASDALSSTAYATQEILTVLALAGAAAFAHAFPISLTIVALLIIVTVSYQQTIHAYPGGGGAYTVARDNLGELPAQVAGAALLTDYVLTVSVSVSSGIAQVCSAVPALYGHRVALSIMCVVLIMIVNLRGVRESGVVFAVPTYFFIVTMVLMVGIALFRYAQGSLGLVSDPPHPIVGGALQPLTLFLLLHAFSNGTTALTGIEAISNGITAFKEPRSHNAGVTLLWMAAILTSLFLGITFLATHVGAIPSEQETVVSQLARTVFGGRGVLYGLAIAATTLILVMAANTAYADFPRLAALQAGDGFLPRQLTYRGSRLVFSRGIAMLALLASALILMFQASVTSLIPLYAIGVFLSFTLSQAGMTRRWWKVGRLAPGQEIRERGSVLRYEPGWEAKMCI